MFFPYGKAHKNLKYVNYNETQNVYCTRVNFHAKIQLEYIYKANTTSIIDIPWAKYQQELVLMKNHRTPVASTTHQDDQDQQVRTEDERWLPKKFNYLICTNYLLQDP